MTTYYDYLRQRLQAAPATNPAQLEHLIHAERNALWQRIASNPLYDEQTRMGALAAFDEAAARVFSEHAARLDTAAEDIPNILTRRAPQHAEPAADQPIRPRSILRDVLFLVIGMALGFAAGYFVKAGLGPVLSSSAAAPDNALGIQGLSASQRSFKFVRSNPSALEGEITVEYAGSAPTGATCTVDATYRQILEYVRFNESCETVAFKFRPLPDLWQDFNYLEGYVVFTAAITSPAGARWEGSASVYFSINGTT